MSLSDLPWDRGEPNGELLRENCLLYDQSNEVYFDFNCKYRFCSLCQFKEEAVFKLKGLCGQQTIIDSDYIFIYDQEELLFRGLLGRTHIILNTTSGNWELMDSLNSGDFSNGLIGYFNDSNKFPLGLHTWSLFLNCEQMLTNLTYIALKLSKVKLNLK